MRAVGRVTSENHKRDVRALESQGRQGQGQGHRDDHDHVYHAFTVVRSLNAIA